MTFIKFTFARGWAECLKVDLNSKGILHLLHLKHEKHFFAFRNHVLVIILFSNFWFIFVTILFSNFSEKKGKAELYLAHDKGYLPTFSFCYAAVYSWRGSGFGLCLSGWQGPLPAT